MNRLLTGIFSLTMVFFLSVGSVSASSDGSVSASSVGSVSTSSEITPNYTCGPVPSKPCLAPLSSIVK